MSIAFDSIHQVDIAFFRQVVTAKIVAYCCTFANFLMEETRETKTAEKQIRLITRYEGFGAVFISLLIRSKF